MTRDDWICLALLPLAFYILRAQYLLLKARDEERKKRRGL